MEAPCPPRIRPWCPKDLPQIQRIYTQAIEAGLCTADLRPPPPARWRTWSQTHQDPRYPVFVAGEGEHVAGYCSLSPYRPGREALRSLAEVSYYVDRAYHRRGIASALIFHAMGKARELEHRHLLAILIEDNRASLRLLEKLGFQQWGHLPGILEYQGQLHGQLYLGKSLQEAHLPNPC
jgi:phosphinothricin acetyltransferase